jgi:hypothetical protein
MISCIVIVLKFFKKIQKKKKRRKDQSNKFLVIKIKFEKNIGTDIITQFWIPKYCSMQNVYFLI